MRIFDQIDFQNLDRREFHLWLLTITVVVVLALGLGLLMYPAAFPREVTLSGSILRILFFGFCGLAVLTIGYLLDRQLTVMQLRKAVQREKQRSTEIRCQASNDLLNSLSGLNHFQDRLAMEYRRAANIGAPLSILVIDIKLAKELVDNPEPEVTEFLGDAVVVAARKLRKEDSLYHFCSTFFGAILPAVGREEAYQFLKRIEEGLRDAAGASVRFSASIQAFSYPDNASTAHELLQAVRSRLPAGLLGEPELDADLLVAQH